MRVRVALPAVALAAVAAAAAPALAAGVSIHASPSSVHRGHVVRVYGKVPGCPKGSSVTLLSNAFVHTHDFAGVPAVYATVGSASAYSVKTKIPAGKKPGRYTISGRCGGGNLGVTATLHVLS